MGAVVASEMLVSGAFAGPVVLLGISLSAPDEPRLFRAIIRLGSVSGTLPAAALKKSIGSVLKRPAIAPERQAELRTDFARNNTRDMRRGLQAYLRWLHRDDDRARGGGARVCLGVPPPATTTARGGSARRQCPHGSCMPRKATVRSPRTN